MIRRGALSEEGLAELLVMLTPQVLKPQLLLSGR